MKGGESMHFRQNVLKGILIGAALFFPTNAFAEKADHTPKLPIQSEKETVQKQNQATGDQVKKSKALEKPEKSQKSEKSEKPVVKKTAVNTYSKKPVEKKKALPEQASPKAKDARESTGKKPKQAGVMNASVKKVASHREKKSIIKKQTKNVTLDKETSKQDVTKKPLHSKEKVKISNSNENEFVHELNIQRPIVIETNIMPKLSSPEDQESPRNQKTPDPVTSFPDDILMIFSQGSYHSGESAKDRKNTGYNTYSLNDKWFIRWEKYWILESSQSFIFQNHKISSQWMNAPPFQPPKSFLFS